ncbi:Ribonuclease J OS=Tsukamurella paurometabola (strain ATCC 8368 / DSM / CCUG 35730 / CIP 100753/ JCM 10117 / KCTC 9821 / NBRC 16120 / NCIMB 702349 / NCTC 13040) OX=521096 GN=rnj PE=3 SV=1 [Tsukamurella paurometabola]|uniref:Ribonuclease J n=1 Tax=Tsukamurella paurometabola (strain ATCC 8368 / DSM 20162 / CCUG 35730 / CIP 100753 / JCM 10117 / KCTC 9821 / NBRC 16120 / NCIMB 702349 / NCTC 13040) TaxID=521096 RepID=D5UMA1_TSUPD|nr:ribonuclease J [Tsukamurella paurometabola]ADG78381.1 beta-lactamase domain protein [Tsukamurella paurometabola DSM 20162]SUP31421.1 Putative ribonuclease J Rv2752c [Tsukamurella paurometabola]
MTDTPTGGARRGRKATRQAGPPAEPKPVISTSAARVVVEDQPRAEAKAAEPKSAETAASQQKSASKGGRGRGGGNRRGNDRGSRGAAPSTAAPRLGPPPKLRKGGMRVVALGGIKEIGRNMTVFEYDGKLLIVDCGVLFPEDQQPGVDLILPDFRYIEDRIKDVEAIVLTHGHEDHIGAVPFLLRLRPDIPVIGAKFTLALIKAKCDEHRLRPKLIEVREGESTSHGPFECEYFAVNHSIPDAIAVAIHAGGQVALHTGDIKLDQLPLDGRLTDLAGFSRLGDAGVDLFLVDSTNAEVPGFVTPEREIGPVLDNVIGRAKGRVIVASFASHVHRIQQIVDVAVAHNRRVVFVGRSMVRNMQIAQDMGYLRVPEGVEVDLDTAASLPDHRIVLVSTGSQGEPLSALSRMARGEHRNITISPHDLVVLASSLIPGNENSVFAVVNGLAKLGATVVTQQSAKVHVSGHASAGELLYLYNAVRPRNAMPVHGEWRHLRANAALAEATGVPKDRIMLAEDGVVVDLIDGVAKIVGQVPVGHVYVDGSSVGDVGESTLSDRLVLGEGGFIAISIVIDEEGNSVTTPEVSGRGFSDDPTALKEAEQLVEDTLAQLSSEGIKDQHRIAQAVRRAVGRWVSNTYRRRPMIVPTVMVVGE